MQSGRTLFLVVIASTLPACSEVLGADFTDPGDECSTEGELRCADGLVCRSGKWVTDPGTLTCEGQDVVGCKGDHLDVIESCKGPCQAGECREVVKVDVSHQNACALLDDGTVWCWGDAYLGALGLDPALVFVRTPAPVPGLSGVTDLALGDHFGCALRDDGKVACWGSNTAGQLGAKGAQWRSEPLEVEPLVDVGELFVSSETACARKKDGTFVCWGRAPYPCMPDADEGWAAFSPVPLPELGTTSQLFSTLGVLCGVVEPNGDLYCCQDGSIAAYPKNGAVSNVVAGAGGHDHLCTIGKDDTLACWGGNQNGQLCLGSTGNPSSGSIALAGPLTHLGAGFATTYLIDSKGALRCCGDNRSSECGIPSSLGTEFTTPVPSAVTSNAAWTWVRGGWKFACGLTTDHEVMCWGDNTLGVTGTDEYLVATPTPVVWQP